MSDQIALAYRPSKDLKDWSLRSDGDHNWFFEQDGHFYCTGHKKYVASEAGWVDGHPRQVGKEPYYDLTTGQFTEAPRVYIDHYPEKGEWEHFKTIDDVIGSELYLGEHI